MAKLKELREGQYLSQVDLAKKAGLSESTVNRLEKGLETPRWVTIRKLAAALGVEPGQIEWEADKQPAPPTKPVSKVTPAAGAEAEATKPSSGPVAPGERKYFRLGSLNKRESDYPSLRIVTHYKLSKPILTDRKGITSIPIVTFRNH